MTRHQLHHLRDANGFLKAATVSVNYNVSLSTQFILKFDNPTLAKAQDKTAPEWSTKLVSNKIRIVGVLYNLLVEPLIPSSSGQYPLSFPVRLDLLRQTQASGGENETRYTSDNSYLKKHSYTIPSAKTDIIDISSMFNCPLERAELGMNKVYDVNFQQLKAMNVTKYNSDQLSTSAFRGNINYFSRHIATHCEVDIPDDGLSASVIPLSTCVGQLPELFYVTCYNNRVTSSPFNLSHSAIVTGQITYLYQDIGTVLTHL